MMGRRPATVRRGRSSRPSEPETVRGTSFFKVLLLDFTQKLRIPPAFIKCFNGKVPYESILRSPTGRVWHVKVNKVGNGLFFQNGWPDFVEENILQMGEVLVFTYQGNSEFDVKMFGKSGCEKEETSMIKKDESSSGYEKEEASEKHECGSYKEVKEEQLKELFFKSTNTCQCLGQKKYSCPFKIKHQHYTISWGRRMLYKMPVPKTFLDASGMGTKASVLLHDPKGKTWRVKVISLKDGRTILGAGWAALARANGLLEGNVCGLECIIGKGRGKRRVLKVHIFHPGG
ncbi:hypothetical protein MRB53_011728 [Persea americana]|uniref:Uncharacterized protein n=1 Tax=Persea americana TaxID=3435 RepID=A0ACC2LWI7_PERAE|nr:hypothetical protein MRB53_011728 [Persea americana]